jgi:hypothetical protein
MLLWWPLTPTTEQKIVGLKLAKVFRTLYIALLFFVNELALLLCVNLSLVNVPKKFKMTF